MKSRWRLSAWSGAAIGVATAAGLSWFWREGQQALLSSIFALEGEGSRMAAFWLLFALGAVLVAVVVAAQFHPLISAIPAAWFLIGFGPVLFGSLSTPAWYPEWLSTYSLERAGEAAPLITGVLVTATVAAYVRRRLPSPDPVDAEAEEVRL